MAVIEQGSVKIEDPEVPPDDIVASNDTRNIFPSVYTAEDRHRVDEMYNGNLFLPWRTSYKSWRALTLIAAIYSLFFESYQITFSPAGLYATDMASIVEYLLLIVFALDVVVQFNVAFFNDRDDLCCDRG